MYYDPLSQVVVDYHGGLADARARLIRMIGDAETRYREDPVRMLRAARFAAKLGFTLHPDTEGPVRSLAYLLDGVPPARLFDETMKLLLAGSAAASCNLLARLGLLSHLMPEVVQSVNEAPESPPARLVQLGLAGTDQRVRADKSVTPTFLFAVLLWPAILRAAGAPHGPMPQDLAILAPACDGVVSRQLRRIAVPKRFMLPMRDIVLMQPRFERRDGRRALRLLEHPRFRAAYDFLLLRAASGEIDPELASWWTRLQELPQADRLAEVASQPGGGEAPPRRRSRRRRRRPAE
jgi:poly(A) polymerase